MIFVALIPSPVISTSNNLIDIKDESPLKQKSQTALIKAESDLSILTIGDFGNLFPNSNPYDPAILANLDQWRKLSLLFDTLVTYDPETRTLSPGLAKQWIVSNDSKYWLFTLKENIFFHDGSKFNASSVKFTFSRLYDPSNPAYIPKEGNDLPLKSIELKSEFEVVFRFFEPHSPFIYDEATNLYIISPNSFNGSTLTYPIGTGPYSLDISSSNSTFQNFTRFPEYFGGLAPFEQIHSLTYQSYDDLVSAITTQEVDIIPSFHLNIDDYFLNNDDWNLTTSNKSYTTMFGWFNHHRPEIANLNVRLALNYAINHQPLIDIYEGYASFSRSIIPPSAPFYDDEVLGYPYDVEKARTLLDNAGYGINEEGHRFTIEIVTPTYPFLINPIISDLNAIGILGNVTYLNSIEEIVPRWLNGEFDVFILGGSFVFNPQMEYDHFHTNGSHNNGMYSNTSVDNFLDLSLQTPVFQEREYYLKEMQKLIQQDAPFLHLLNVHPFYARRSEITPYVDLLYERFIFQYLPFPDPSYRLLTDETTFSSQNNEIHFMENIELSNLSIYFPFTDAIMTIEGTDPVKFNMSMSLNLTAFISSQELIGKYYLISADTPDVWYRFRCYYDPSEIKSIPPDKLALFQYDDDVRSWLEVDIISANSSLRYIEIDLKGEYNLIRLGEAIARLTYRNLPLFSLIVGGMVSFALLTIFFNYQYTKRFKERFKLN
jgi:peptide/nickel transport system substrate-binding protein